MGSFSGVPSRVINKTGIREMMGIPRSSHGGTGAELNDGNGAILQCHAFGESGTNALVAHWHGLVDMGQP